MNDDDRAPASPPFIITIYDAQAAWRQRHPGAAAAASKRWRTRNPDKVREQNKRWREANRDKFNASAAAWRRANPEKVRANEHIRRAREAGAQSEPWTPGDIYKRDGGLCQICSAPLPAYTWALGRRDGYTIDHIHPLSRGGSNLKTNLQPSCFRCNVSKKARI